MDQTTEMLKKMMDVCSLRQSVLANNIANANTKNYRRQDVNFKKAFADAVKSGNPEDFAAIKPEVKIDRDAPVGATGNSVSMQSELTKMANNSLLYGVSAQVLSSKYSRLQSVIKGR